MVISCSKKELPDYIYGEWTSEEIEITVRLEPNPGQFEFFDGKGVVTLTINQDQTVDGHIGRANFENAPFTKTLGKFGSDQIDIRIKCGYISEIFIGDPVSRKEVEIFMGLNEESSDADLRYSEGMANFPMASFELTKRDQ